MEAEAPKHYVIIVATAFMLTFGCFNAVQQQLTSLFGHSGYFVLSTNQAAFVVGTVVGAAVGTLPAATGRW